MRAALCNVIPHPLCGGCILSNVFFLLIKKQKNNYITLSEWLRVVITQP